MQIHPETRKEWRAWLRKHHKKETKVNLVSWKKHTKKPSFSHNEAMREAICFGWIDTTVKRLDEDRYQRSFVRRTHKSSWSNNTIRYAEEEIAKKKMSKFGMEMYEIGELKPTIDYNLPKNPDTPEDLKKALGKHLDKFKKLAPSTRRYHIYYIEKAKRTETRQKRIKQVVQLLKDDQKLI
jgi:uncharacterized protein YdeI (YjbR/CyaY-like superfamily)